MEILPSRRKFLLLSGSGRRVPVAARLPLESDAAALFEAAAFGSPCVLLESARLHPVTGRWSVIAGEPSKSLTAVGDRMRLLAEGRESLRRGDPFETVERLLAAGAAERLPGFPPFVGGAVGAIGFEAARLLERLPVRAKDDLGLPDLAFLFFDEAVVLDHLKRELWGITLDRSYDRAVSRIEVLLSRVGPSAPGMPGRARREAGAGRVPASFRDFVQQNGRAMAERRAQRFLAGESQAVRSRATRRGGADPISTHTRESFEAMVRRAKELIAAGEIYQANLSQRFSAPLPEEPWSLYRRLTRINPSPFAAYADFGPFQIVSASPERLLRVRGERAETRPIAGTRPRGATAVETARLRRELILNEKERAEHLMLVDLERNDLGRVCRYDTVRVDDLMGMEEYSHVIHIVSNVHGRVRERTGFRELAAALFPGGTISGCPKLRCLRIIGELEPVRRHFYTGSLGYVSYSGEMDLNILIRTAVVREGRVHVQTGAGIVADSDPAREYDETLHKARALLEALGSAPVPGRRAKHHLLPPAKSGFALDRFGRLEGASR